MINRSVGKVIVVRVCGVRFGLFFFEVRFVDGAFNDSVENVHHSSGGRVQMGRHTVIP